MRPLHRASNPPRYGQPLTARAAWRRLWRAVRLCERGDLSAHAARLTVEEVHARTFLAADSVQTATDVLTAHAFALAEARHG